MSTLDPGYEVEKFGSGIKIPDPQHLYSDTKGVKHFREIKNLKYLHDSEFITGEFYCSESIVTHLNLNLNLIAALSKTKDILRDRFKNKAGSQNPPVPKRQSRPSG